jgi:flagellar hook protein FlgE
MVALIQARASFTANTKVIKTEDQMAKSLLDIVS